MEYRKQKDLQYVRSLFDNTTNVSGTVLKLDVDNGFTNYKDKIGNPMNEKTLIVGDENNNVLLVFKQHQELVPVKVFDGVNIISRFQYKDGYLLHRKQQPTDVPLRIVNIVMQQNNVYNANNFKFITKNTTNKFNNLKINLDASEYKKEHSKSDILGQTQIVRECPRSNSLNHKFVTFMHRFYKEGGMVPIKNVKMHPEWTKEYEKYITTKRVNMCKSCKGKAHKGCCSGYSSGNRVMIKMVIGWYSDTTCPSE